MSVPREHANPHRGYRSCTMSTARHEPDPALGWATDFDAAWAELGRPGAPGRVSRLDRGWSTVVRSIDEARGLAEPLRVRNIGADVAVGDWVIPSDDGERVEHVLERRSAFTRRASFDGMRAVSHTLAANIDVVFLVHALGSPPSPRRLERELVLAFDSGAEPVVVLTKTDLVDDPEPGRVALQEVALGVPVLARERQDGRGRRGDPELRRGQPDLDVPRCERGRQVDARQRAGRRGAPGDVRGPRGRPARPSHHGRGRTRPAARRGVADRHSRRARTESVAVGQRDRAGVRRRVRPDGSLPLPRLQARSGTGMCGAGRDRGGRARSGAGSGVSNG